MVLVREITPYIVYLSSETLFLMQVGRAADGEMGLYVLYLLRRCLVSVLESLLEE